MCESVEEVLRQKLSRFHDSSVSFAVRSSAIGTELTTLLIHRYSYSYYRYSVHFLPQMAS